MENYYDIETGDLKDIWDSDLDPKYHGSPFLSDALKLSTDADMQDWFLERDVKMPQVILHDKLISDALLGTLPIKTEHSYSLNSDGDSMPDSPGSLQNKMDDMDDECYPAISMSTATSNTRRLLDTTTSIDAQTTNTYTSTSSPLHNSSLTALSINLRHTTNKNHQQNTEQNLSNQQQNTIHHTRSVSQSETGSISSSEIDIEDCCIKDEPMSPSSSCPPSPNSNSYGLNLAHMAALTNTNLVFEHKNGSLQLSPTSQSLLKNQQIIINSTGQSKSPQRIVIPKLNIKMEPQSSQLFGLPPTPPSSLPSDESEGNQSPEHHLASPMSPPNMQQTTTISSTITATTSSSTAPTTRRSILSSSSPSSSSSSSSSAASSPPASHITTQSTGGRGYGGSSTRQPIHTPLISSQPKGSTGTLILTEEEKRTLLAEGYPIPTRLPLTKAEEKSLKKIRRKIKNKISAQESRRKKKEYMDQLERKVEILVSENSDYKKRVETLEDSNANLLNQVAILQALLNRQNAKKL